MTRGASTFPTIPPIFQTLFPTFTPTVKSHHSAIQAARFALVCRFVKVEKKTGHIIACITF